MVDLISEMDKKVGKYSLGMKQKLGIAQVIMEKPDIMIFDEPFNGVDDVSVNKIKEIIKKQKENGKLIIITSHIKEDIEHLCDIVYKMNDGEIIKT
jgi:ABC-2 type transport system ATP-binding protein